MKQNYESPKFDILSVNIFDVITTSPVIGDTWLDWVDIDLSKLETTHEL